MRGKAMPFNAPPLAFLGVVERAIQIPDYSTTLLKYNILGLKRVILSYIYPMTLAGYKLAFALYDMDPEAKLVLRIDGDTGMLPTSIVIQAVTSTSGDSLPEMENNTSGSVAVSLGPKDWSFMVLPLPAENLIVLKPGTWQLFLSQNGQDISIGRLVFGVIEAEPLTPERVAAIRSDPNAIKAIRVQYDCKKCMSVVKAYAGLERMPKQESEGYIWYENLPETISCSCGNLNIDLKIIRRNLHGLLGIGNPVVGNSVFVPLYEKGALENVRLNFAALLKEKAPEETFQIFLEENPVLLHQFAPEKIFFKAPILSLRNTDFAIVNHQHELILIELQRPDIKLLKKDGGIHSELQHEFDQAREWLLTADEHRLAVLDCIGIDRKKVGAVRAAVIAGLDAGYDPEHLRRLKGADWGRIKLLTYDDLLAGLGSLVRTVESM
jgi:hypothetical protein